MNLPSEEWQKLWADRANVLTQVRNEILTEGFKGLILVNAGGAAALGAFVQAVWDKPTAPAILPGLLSGIGFLLAGTAVSALGFVPRHLSFFHHKTTEPLKNPWWWAELAVIASAVALFVVGMGTAIYHASRAVPQHSPTTSMVDLCPSWLSKLDWTAIFTALLFFATCALWWATRRLVKGAENTAIRQLRAYISMVPQGLVSTLMRPPDIHAQPVTVSIVTKNHGLTPARQVRFDYDVQVFPHPRPLGEQFPKPTRSIPNRFALAPGEDTPMNFSRPEALTTHELQKIREDAARIYCWGIVSYVDVFDVQQQTEFCISVVGSNFLVDYLLQCYATVREGKPRPALPAGMPHPFNFDTCDRHGHGS